MADSKDEAPSTVLSGDVALEMRSVGVIMAELKDEIIELRKVLQQQPIRSELPKDPLLIKHNVAASKWPRWQVSASAIGILGAGILLGWSVGVYKATAHGDERALLKGLHRVLTQHHGALQQSVQQEIRAVYSKAGYKAPGEK